MFPLYLKEDGRVNHVYTRVHWKKSITVCRKPDITGYVHVAANWIRSPSSLQQQRESRKREEGRDWGRVREG